MNSEDIHSEQILLSVILPTDTAQTIEPVLRNLGRQTLASKLEIVLVSPRGASDVPPEKLEPFAKCLQLEVAEISPLGRARAVGVRAATAPYVFIGETHSFLRPDAAQRLVERAIQEDCTAVVPGFVNENPSGIWSWAAFLGDYGAWSADQDEIELREPPIYNALIRRDALVSLEEDLADALYHGDQLRRSLKDQGARTVFEPSAHIGHVNIDHLRHLWREHFLVGRLIGSRRAMEWAMPKRAVYALAGPLIPFVLMRRALPGISASLQHVPARRRAVATVFVLKSIRALGEVAGYLGVPSAGLENEADQLELQKFAHTTDPSLAHRV